MQGVTIVCLKQTMFIGWIVLQLFCSYDKHILFTALRCGQWTELCCFDWFPHRRSLTWKALILSYISVTSLYVPCNSLIRSFQWPVISMRKTEYQLSIFIMQLFNIYDSIVREQSNIVQQIKNLIITRLPAYPYQMSVINYLTIFTLYIIIHYCTCCSDALNSLWSRTLAQIK
jgi:hypothetical protein